MFRDGVGVDVEINESDGDVSLGVNISFFPADLDDDRFFSLVSFASVEDLLLPERSFSPLSFNSFDSLVGFVTFASFSSSAISASSSSRVMNDVRGGDDGGEMRSGSDSTSSEPN